MNPQHSHQWGRVRFEWTWHSVHTSKWRRARGKYWVRRPASMLTIKLGAGRGYVDRVTRKPGRTIEVGTYVHSHNPARRHRLRVRWANNGRGALDFFPAWY